MSPAQGEVGRDRWLLGALFLAGAVHWLLFFGLPPRLPTGVGDWAKERRYYAVLAEAVREARVPFFVSRPIQETRKFLAIPEVVWSPQVLLLGVLDVEWYVAVQTVLLYGAGFVGCLWLRRRYSLSALPFTLLFLLFNFNGHLTAHLAVGHSMWIGYFLLPFFVLYLLELVNGTGGGRAPIQLALALLAILLQGAFHIFNWCVLLLLLVAVCRWDLARRVAVALLWAGALSACRLLPSAAVWAGRREQLFVSGYPGLGDLAAGLLSFRPPDLQRTAGLNAWEYDAYVGVLGLAWLLGFGVVARWRAGEGRRALDLPIAVMILLSLDSFYYPFHLAGVPLLNAERVTSRLLVLPLLLLVVLAAVAMERSRVRLRRPSVRAAGWGSAVATALVLAAHSATWCLPSLVRIWPSPPRERDLAIQIVAEDPTGTERGTWYAAGAKVAVLVSLAAVLLAAWRLRRVPPSAGDSATPNLDRWQPPQ